jgi:hypothetical protein
MVSPQPKSGPGPAKQSRTIDQVPVVFAGLGVLLFWLSTHAPITPSLGNLVFIPFPALAYAGLAIATIVCSITSVVLAPKLRRFSVMVALNAFLLLGALYLLVTLFSTSQD